MVATRAVADKRHAAGEGLRLVSLFPALLFYSVLPQEALTPLDQEEQGRRSSGGGGDSSWMRTPPGTGLGLSGPCLWGFLPPSSSPNKEECFLMLAGG